MRLSVDSSHIIMNTEEHNHFFRLCQDAHVIVLEENRAPAYVVSMHNVTYTGGVCEILVDIKYIRSNFNLLLLHYYINGQEDKFMDRLRECLEYYDSHKSGDTQWK